MNLKPLILFFALLLLWGCSTDYKEGITQSAEPLLKSQQALGSDQVAIIKADDYGAGPDSMMHPGWQAFVDYIRGKGVKASMGIIGLGIVGGQQPFFDSTKAFHDSQKFEFWNHGYEHIVNQIDSNGHTYSEFQGTDFRYQKLHLRSTQKVVRDKLGFILQHREDEPGCPAGGRNTTACAAATRTCTAASFNAAAATREASERLRLPSRINASRRSSASEELRRCRCRSISR